MGDCDITSWERTQPPPPSAWDTVSPRGPPNGSRSEALSPRGTVPSLTRELTLTERLPHAGPCAKLLSASSQRILPTAPAPQSLLLSCPFYRWRH